MDQNAGSPTAPSIAGPGASREDALKELAKVGSGDGSVLSQLLNNPFFTAGFGLAGLGAAVRYGSQGLRRAAELVRHRMLVDLEITRHDKSYPWVLDWMTNHYQTQLTPGTSQKPAGVFESLIRRLTPGLHHLQIQTETVKTAGGSEKTGFLLVPGHGRHILRYRNAFIAVNRERVGKSFDANGRPFETVKLTTLYHHRHVFEDIFREAHQMALQSTEGKTVIYTSNRMAWEKSGEPKRRRPFDSVVLEEGLADRILGDVQEFLDARTWYLDRGIPYRRGYLLSVAALSRSHPQHFLLIQSLDMDHLGLARHLSCKLWLASWISILQCSVSASVA